MSVFRTCGLLVAFAGIALTLVYLRTEQAGSAARSLELEARWIDLRRELWSGQTELARLRTPTQIRERIERFEVELVPPDGDSVIATVSAQPSGSHTHQHTDNG